MKKTILTDCDGVLLNWLSGLPGFLEDAGHDTSHLKSLLDGNQFVPFFDLFMVDNEQDALEMMDRYHQSEHLTRLPEMEPGSSEAIRRLGQDYEIIVVTSFSDNKIAQRNREENLRLRYGDAITDLVCLPFSADKTEALKSIAKRCDAKIWLDDQIKHVHHGTNAGIDSYQFTFGMSCGRNTGEVAEIDSWTKVERLLSQAV